ncbi:type VI secretion system membrane subunit TssM [Marinimicrobium alkaliphilum]|uniref:type VI secretion system membrane subunit TssM n=1 Tax=Marinimicrobium alkaliphilum TaxID=2202654 RepID=UPI000DBA7525|nr:type VI secretion system membrane subunit TssM [Marinimicrobium alkaliphilum]
MKKLFARLIHPVTLSLLGVVVIALLIWFVGPAIKFGDANVAPLAGSQARLVAIMVVLIIWGLNNLRIQARNHKQNKQLVEDIQESPPVGGQDYASTQAGEEVKEIQQRFFNALTTLRGHKFRGRANKTRALYELPWYIIVGPPGAGKTTALVNSGLEFPLAEQFGRGALQGVGGTRHCDWWFTNEAVLVDTAGRYTTQDSHRVVDGSAWEGFLDLLKKHRRRRPINGVIVAISIQDLLTQPEEERLRHARTIRTRIDELMTKLEVRFPVYLLFTKADLISGFNEFFEDLGRDERDQVWGVTLSDSPHADGAPDFEDIDSELGELEARLYERLVWRMHQERDRERRTAIEQFPRQMEQVHPLVQAFVRETFAPNRYRFQPYLRGVYFSSGTQDGTPIDRLMTAVSSQFGIDREPQAVALGRGKSFFLGRLFRDVIFPESELVGTNPRYERWRRWGQRGAYGALAACVAGLLVIWTGSVGRHAGSMEDVRHHLSAFEASARETPQWDRSVRATLGPLASLSMASDVYAQENHPWLTGVGLYDGRIERRTRQAYHDYLRGPFMRGLLAELERALTETDEDLALYGRFRVYQMFGDVERLAPGAVNEWFRRYWAEADLLSAAEQRQVQAHLAQLLSLELESQPLNQPLSRQVAERLQQVPLATRVYNRIQTEPEYQRRVDMQVRYGDQLSIVFDYDSRARQVNQVPWLYTREGYRAIDLSRRSPVLRELVNDRWIFASLDSTDVSISDDDLSALSEQVNRLYHNDYIRTWNNAMAEIKIKPFTSLNHAGDILGRAADTLNSPLHAVLQAKVDQTRLTDSRVRDAVAGAGRGQRSSQAAQLAASRIDDTPVDRHYRDLHRLMAGGDDSAAPVHATLQEVRKLADFVEEIRMAPNPDQRAFEIARDRYQNGSGNAMTQLRSYARTMPEPMQGWLEELSAQTWRVILGSARNHVSREWHEQVYRPYQRFASGRYPLTAGASAEISMYDFTEFFKPGGTHQRFFQEYVEPFVHTRGRWSNRQVDGYTLGLSGDSLERIRQGLEVTDVMFRGSEPTPRLDLEFRPMDLSAENARFSLDMGGEALSYNHGPRLWRPVTWAGDRAESRLRLRFEGVNGAVRERRYEGGWAWLRALEDARVERTSRADVYRLTFSADSRTDAPDGRDEIVYEVRAQSVNNIFNDNPLRQYRCPEVL